MPRDNQKEFRHQQKLLNLDFDWSKIDEETFINEAAAEMFREVRRTCPEVRYVVIDMLMEEDKEWEYILGELQGLDVVKVLVYCPLPVLTERVGRRNKSGSEEEQRSLTQALEQFKNIYKSKERDNEIILDELYATDITTSCALARNESDDEKPLFETEEKFQEFQSDILKKLNLDTNETIQVTPRRQYNVVVNTNTNTPMQCAEQIRDFLQEQESGWAASIRKIFRKWVSW